MNLSVNEENVNDRYLLISVTVTFTFHSPKIRVQNI